MKRLFCRLFHNDLGKPGGNTMWCRRCHTRWTVPWATKQPVVNGEPVPVLEVRFLEVVE